jgi:hypothetical protein
MPQQAVYNSWKALDFLHENASRLYSKVKMLLTWMSNIVLLYRMQFIYQDALYF